MEAGTVEILELRCPDGPRQLLMKLRLNSDPDKPQVTDDNLLEITCRDCARQQRQFDPSVARVLHRFNFAGELVESVVERR
jgi:hypothetical protein